MSSSVHWIKVYTDMVSNKKIRRIRTLPEGNNIILIWVFLLAQAGESNKNGALYLTDTIPFTPEDLAVEFEFEVSIIKFALITLEKYSMIEVFEEIIYIKNWGEYQNIDGMDKIREQTRLRTAIYRDKQKSLPLCDATCDVTVTHGDATEVDKEVEVDKEEEYIPYREIIFYLNEKTGSKYKVSSEKTKGLIKTRWNEKFTLDDFKSVIDKKCASWTGTEQEKFLRPETLFGNKFEGYVNEKVTAKKGSVTAVKKSPGRFDNFYNT